MPQIEAPQRTADLLLPWLSTLPQTTSAPFPVHHEPATDDSDDGPPDLLAGAS